MVAFAARPVLALCLTAYHIRAPAPLAAATIDAADAASRLRSGAAALVDIRQPAEFRLDGRIDGSVNLPAYSWEHGFHVPLPDFAETVAEDLPRDGEILLIHSYPALADGAASVLEAAGFSNVASVEGGLNSWEEELIVDDDEGLVGAWV